MKAERSLYVVVTTVCCLSWLVTGWSLAQKTESSDIVPLSTITPANTANNNWLDIAGNADLFDPQRRSFSQRNTINDAEKNAKHSQEEKDILNKGANQQLPGDTSKWQLVAITQDKTIQAVIAFPDSQFRVLNVGDITPDGRKITKIEPRQLWLEDIDQPTPIKISLFTYQ